MRVWEIAGSFPGERTLVGRRYKGPRSSRPLADREPGGCPPVIAGDFVTAEDGTGLVHIAPAFGEDDFDVAAAEGIFESGLEARQSLYNPVTPDGRFDNRVIGLRGPLWSRIPTRDPALNRELIEHLAKRGLLFREETYRACLPASAGAATPRSLYYAKTRWYIQTATAVTDRLLAKTSRSTGIPSTSATGRFGNWLENNVDWALSRDRYWGTPLPIWECDDPAATAALRRVAWPSCASAPASRSAASDLHRPYIDEVTVALSSAAAGRCTA